MKHTFNNRIGHRGRRHINLIVLKGHGVVEFTGESIPPALRVTSVDYTRDGKWSHHRWECEIDENQAFPTTLSQDWETGEYFPSRTWANALSHLRQTVRADEHGITDAMLETFIRARFPEDADRFDEEEANNSNNNKIAELLAAQAELAAAQKEAAELVKKTRQMEEAERLRAEADATRQRVAKAREMMAKGVSLADLKAILGA